MVLGTLYCGLGGLLRGLWDELALVPARTLDCPEGALLHTRTPVPSAMPPPQLWYVEFGM